MEIPVLRSLHLSQRLYIWLTPVPLCRTPETIPVWISYGIRLLLPWRHHDVFVHLVFPHLCSFITAAICCCCFLSGSKRDPPLSPPVSPPSFRLETSGGSVKPVWMKHEARVFFWWMPWRACFRHPRETTAGFHEPLDVAVVANKSLPRSTPCSTFIVYPHTCQYLISQQTRDLPRGLSSMGRVHVWADAARHSLVLDINLNRLHRHRLQSG